MSKISNLRKRRGATKGSITRLSTRLKALESKVHKPTTLDLTKQMASNLKSLDEQFKEQHFKVIDKIDEKDKESLEREQKELDDHDEELPILFVRIQQLIQKCSAASESCARKTTSHSLADLQVRLASVETATADLTDAPEKVHILHQYNEQFGDFKTELGAIRQGVLTMGIESTDELFTTIAGLDQRIFDASLKVKGLLYRHKKATPSEESSHASTTSHGVRLHKLDVPTFGGDILDWRTFWEQFRIAVHDRTNLSNTEKLAYLTHSLKDGTAKSTIEGLSQTGDHYDEAVKCLEARYNRPKLIHQAHVKKIVDIPALKDGSGRELRRLHDTALQHIRVLKSMNHEPDKTFIKSFLQLMLDPTTLFEWQKHDQKSTDVSHYDKFLEFINLRAQASETLTSERPKSHRSDNARKHPPARSATFTASVNGNCIVCKTERHALFACPTFKSMPRDQMMSTLRSNDLCLNCLKPGHFSKQCPSTNRCRKCHKPHHTLIHNDSKEAPVATAPPQVPSPAPSTAPSTEQIQTSHALAGSNVPNTLLMTCQVLVSAPDGTSIEARALLDSGSTMSFISERIIQCLNLQRRSQCLTISGIGDMSHKSPLSSVSTFEISSLYSPPAKYTVTAIVVPRVTCNLPLQPVHNSSRWNHLSNLSLADPDFGVPGRIDMLLGADMYADVVLYGRRCGPPGTPTAFETRFGWVLTGRTTTHSATQHSVASYHASVTTGDDILRMFWEIEESPKDYSNLSAEERSVVRHFNETHTQSETGRFVVPLPKSAQCKLLGESRSQAVRRFLSLERSLYSKGQFKEFSVVMEEYFEMGHAEPVPTADLQKSPKDTFCLPMHAVRKEHSTTTKVRVVFDASAKSATGVSLNDTLLVGPTIHPPLIDVLLRFRSHRIALTADISKMYRAIELVSADRDLHRFVWRKSPSEPLRDYRMTRVTFGVSASSFAANMAVKQNALDFVTEFPKAAKVVDKSFYVDDCLTGADSVTEAINLQTQLHSLFSKGGFLLRKWNSSETEVLKHIPSELKDVQAIQSLPAPDEYTKTLGIEWNSSMDHFCLTVAKLPPLNNITKRVLVSDIAKTFDILGWFSPTIIKVKILLQRLWEQKIDWDDPVPTPVYDDWLQWRSELHLLSSKHIPRCYFNKKSQIISIQLHGFCDASESAYHGCFIAICTWTFSRPRVKFSHT